jgi:hypothetical protein
MPVELLFFFLEVAVDGLPVFKLKKNFYMLSAYLMNPVELLQILNVYGTNSISLN